MTFLQLRPCLCNTELWIMLFKMISLQDAIIWLWKINRQNKSRIVVEYHKNLGGEKRKQLGKDILFQKHQNQFMLHIIELHVTLM